MPRETRARGTEAPPPRASDAADVADAFGARVSISDEAEVLVLVAGTRGASPHSAVASVGGRVLVDFPEGRLLAVVQLSAQPDLRRHPDVVLAGPVAVDVSRFSQFMELIGVQEAPGTNEARI